LLQRRRDCARAAFFAALEQKARDLLDEHGGTTPDRHKTLTFLRFPRRFRGLVLVIGPS
jgi:hypothetical protein